MRPENKHAVDSVIIGSRIRFCRERRGLSIRPDQAAFRYSELIKYLSPTALSDIENGRKRIGLTSLVLVADALELSLDWLVYGTTLTTYGGFKGNPGESVDPGDSDDPVDSCGLEPGETGEPVEPREPVDPGEPGNAVNPINLLSGLSNRDQMIVMDLIESLKRLKSV